MIDTSTFTDWFKEGLNVCWAEHTADTLITRGLPSARDKALMACSKRLEYQVITSVRRRVRNHTTWDMLPDHGEELVWPLQATVQRAVR